MARNKASIGKNYYRVLHRDPAAFTTPASAADFTTFIGTLTELGICEDKSIKLNTDENESINIDTGEKCYIDELGTFEFMLTQSAVADHTRYTAVHKVAQDYFLYAEDQGRCIFIPNISMFYKEQLSGGEVEKVQAVYERMITDKADFFTRFDEPTS
jgi:hypothetical protein